MMAGRAVIRRNGDVVIYIIIYSKVNRLSHIGIEVVPVSHRYGIY